MCVINDISISVNQIVVLDSRYTPILVVCVVVKNLPYNYIIFKQLYRRESGSRNYCIS